MTARPPNRLLTCALLLVLVGALAACGTDSGGSPTPGATAAPTPAHTGTPAASAAPTAARTDAAATGSSATTRVHVTEKDYNITLDPSIVPPGKVVFQLTNKGPHNHEFILVKTDLAEDKLPTSKGSVQEADPKLTKIGHQDSYSPTDSPTLTENLEAGHYVAICNLPGHYQQGMHTTLTVGDGAAATAAAATATAGAATPAPAATPNPAAGGGPTTIGITERDYQIALSQSYAPTGTVIFTMTNQGPGDHGLLVLKTDLSPDNLPVDKKTDQVQLNAPGIEQVAAQAAFQPGAAPVLTTTLDPGTYVLISNQPGDYRLGMSVELKVTYGKGAPPVPMTATPPAGGTPPTPASSPTAGGGAVKVAIPGLWVQGGKQ